MPILIDLQGWSLKKTSLCFLWSCTLYRSCHMATLVQQLGSLTTGLHSHPVSLQHKSSPILYLRPSWERQNINS